jgi:hypothetical protein
VWRHNKYFSVDNLSQENLVKINEWLGWTQGSFMSARKLPPPQVQNRSKDTRRKWILWTSAVVIGAALMGEQWLALLLLLAGIFFFGTIIVASFHDHFIEGRGSSGDRHRADSGDFGGGGA